MNIMVDILHPAHVHFFRNAIIQWKRNHEVLVTSRRKDIAIELLDALNIEHTCLSELKGGRLGLFKELFVRDFNLFKLARKFKPDVLTGIAGVSIAHVGALIRKPSIVFYDTEFAKLSNAITYPLATVVCTPECYQGDIGKNQLRYPGYHELAYLHPNRFKPDKAVRDALNVGKERFFILRFVSWEASHDFKEQGLTFAHKTRLVEELKAYGRVFITSEKELPETLRSHQYPLPSSTIHHAMAFATLLVGESATMCSEAAMLGVPSIYISKTGRGYTDEQERKYGLVFNYNHNQQDQAIAKALELVQRPELESEWQHKRSIMLNDRIDVTEFIVKFVETYPQSPQDALDLIRKPSQAFKNNGKT